MKTESKTPTTHYVHPDLAARRIAYALCGHVVSPRREHALEPTCPRCQQLLAARERIAV